MIISKFEILILLSTVFVIIKLSDGFKKRKYRNHLLSKIVKKDVIPATIWWKGTNGKSYTITSKANGYYETSDACESVNGYLASIMNVKDQETVNIAIRKLKPQNETFLWIGQPSSSNALQDCGAAGREGAWFSIGCDEKHHGICENIGAGTSSEMLKVLNLINETKNGNETKAGNETNREDGKLMKPGKMGKLQGTPEKQKQGGNFGLKKDEKCNLIKFINNYGHPVIISRGVNSHDSKEFRVEGKSYKLKTVIKNVQKTDKIEPVVYTAKDGRKDVGKKLLLGERDSFSLIPGDCDGEFIDVVISSQTNLPPKGLILQESKERNNSRNDVKETNEEESRTRKCKVETFGGNAEESCCHFPFKLKGRMYYDCTFFTKKHMWCGTTHDYDNDGQWGYCCQDGDCTHLTLH